MGVYWLRQEVLTHQTRVEEMPGLVKRHTNLNAKTFKNAFAAPAALAA